MFPFAADMKSLSDLRVQISIQHLYEALVLDIHSSHACMYGNVWHVWKRPAWKFFKMSSFEK